MMHLTPKDAKRTCAQELYAQVRRVAGQRRWGIAGVDRGEQNRVHTISISPRCSIRKEHFKLNQDDILFNVTLHRVYQNRFGYQPWSGLKHVIEIVENMRWYRTRYCMLFDITPATFNANEAFPTPRGP